MSLDRKWRMRFGRTGLVTAIVIAAAGVPSIVQAQSGTARPTKSKSKPIKINLGEDSFSGSGSGASSPSSTPKTAVDPDSGTAPAGPGTEVPASAGAGAGSGQGQVAASSGSADRTLGGVWQAAQNVQRAVSERLKKSQPYTEFESDLNRLIAAAERAGATGDKGDAVKAKVVASVLLELKRSYAPMIAQQNQILAAGALDPTGLTSLTVIENRIKMYRELARHAQQALQFEGRAATGVAAEAKRGGLSDADAKKLVSEMSSRPLFTELAAVARVMPTISSTAIPVLELLRDYLGRWKFRGAGAGFEFDTNVPESAQAKLYQLIAAAQKASEQLK